jgi:hypothetical protein
MDLLLQAKEIAYNKTHTSESSAQTQSRGNSSGTCAFEKVRKDRMRLEAVLKSEAPNFKTPMILSELLDLTAKQAEMAAEAIISKAIKRGEAKVFRGNSESGGHKLQWFQAPASFSGAANEAITGPQQAPLTDKTYHPFPGVAPQFLSGSAEDTVPQVSHWWTGAVNNDEAAVLQDSAKTVHTRVNSLRRTSQRISPPVIQRSSAPNFLTGFFVPTRSQMLTANSTHRASSMKTKNERPRSSLGHSSNTQKATHPNASKVEPVKDVFHEARRSSGDRLQFPETIQVPSHSMVSFRCARSKAEPVRIEIKLPNRADKESNLFQPDLPFQRPASTGGESYSRSARGNELVPPTNHLDLCVPASPPRAPRPVSSKVAAHSKYHDVRVGGQNKNAAKTVDLSIFPASIPK